MIAVEPVTTGTHIFSVVRPFTSSVVGVDMFIGRYAMFTQYAVTLHPEAIQLPKQYG